MMTLKLLKLDTNLYDASNETNTSMYYANSSNYANIPFKPKLDPTNAWAIPFVTGHKYKAHWQSGLDFDRMQMTLSPRWNSSDKGIYFVFNFTDVREKVEVISGGEVIENMTMINKTSNLWQTGDNVIYNDTATRQIHLYVNG